MFKCHIIFIIHGNYNISKKLILALATDDHLNQEILPQQLVSAKQYDVDCMCGCSQTKRKSN